MRAIALAVTILLVLFEIILGRRIPGQPYSGILINNLSVERVTPGSPGEAAGLQKGDAVLAVEGVACSNFTDISRCVSRARPGASR
jgi:S1-C subfamily serine protease